MYPPKTVPATKAIRQYSSFKFKLKKDIFFPAPATVQYTLKEEETPKDLPTHVDKKRTIAITKPEKAQCHGWLSSSMIESGKKLTVMVF